MRVAVLDCGIGIYCTFEPIASAPAGETLALTGSLGVDPFTYFEQLAEEKAGGVRLGRGGGGLPAPSHAK